MAEETIYSAASPLRTPKRFLSTAIADLKVVPHAAWRLFVRNLQSRYRQSALRWAWLIMPPLVTTLTWVFLGNSGVVDLGDTRMPYAAYAGAGTVIWQLFLDSLNTPMRSLGDATSVLKFARLPHESWIAAGVLDVLFSFVVRFVLVLIVVVASGTLGGTTLLLVPLGLFGTMLLGLGLGMLLAVAGRLYTDVGQALTVGTGVWFFITPIVYARPIGGFAGRLIGLNPVTPALMSTRAWLTGTPGAMPLAFVCVSAASAFLLVAGWLLYRVAQPHLVVRL